MALAAILAGKLPLMRIGIVAIGTEIVRHRALEVAVFVAIVTGCFSMRAMQRELGFVVIEARCRNGLQHLPAGRHVAALAGGGEGCAVRVLMAIRAGGERDFFVGDEDLGAFRMCFVTLSAGHLLVKTGKGVAGQAVVEAAGGFPGVQRVAAGAVFSQFPAMLVVMAGATSR